MAESEKKDIRVAVYFGETDHAKLAVAAKKLRLSVPQFVRMKVMELVDKTPNEPLDDKK